MSGNSVGKEGGGGGGEKRKEEEEKGGGGIRKKWSPPPPVLSLSAKDFDLGRKVKLGSGSFGSAYRVRWRRGGGRGEEDVCVKEFDIGSAKQFVYLFDLFIYIFIYLYYNPIIFSPSSLSSLSSLFFPLSFYFYISITHSQYIYIYILIFIL